MWNRPRSRRWTYWAPAAVGIATLLVVAGGETAGVSAKSSSGSVTLGVLQPFTGAYAFVGEASLQGATVAAKEINANGGVLGKKVTLDHADTLGDPADAVPAAHSLLSVDGAQAVIGPGGLEISAVQPILTKAKIPFMFEGGDTNIDTNTDPYLWRDTASDAQEGVGIALYALHKHYKTAVMMMTSITSAQDFVPVIEKTYKAGGGKVLDNVELTPSQSSYQSQIQQIINLHPQVIFTQMDPVTAGTVFAEFQQLDGLAIPFIGTDTTIGSNFISAVTAAVSKKALVSCQGATADTPSTGVFTKWFQKLYGKKAQPDANAVNSYDGAIVLALAIDKAGTTSGPKVIKAIPEVANPPGTLVYSYAQGLKDIKAGKKIKYEGASGPFTYNKYHNVFGPFEIDRATSSGSYQTIYTVPASAIQKASGS